MKKTLMVASIMLLAASMSYAQNTATASLTVSVGTEAAISVTASPALTSSTTFGDYTSTTQLNYKVRTGAIATTAGITVEITQDFSTGGANGGPSVASPPTSGDLLTYSCTAVAPPAGTATPCTGSVTASTSAATSVVAFGVNTQSLKVGNGATTSWDLINDPNYKAGSYTAIATYTISAI
jgi:hypothetical protein